MCTFDFPGSKLPQMQNSRQNACAFLQFEHFRRLRVCVCSSPLLAIALRDTAASLSLFLSL